MLRAGCRVPGAGCRVPCFEPLRPKHALRAPGRVEAWHPGTRILLGWQALANHVLHRVAEAI